VLAVTATPALAGNAGFVKVQNAQFTLDGQRFDFVGTVAFALLAGKIYGMESFTHDVIASARANGFRVVRTWGYFLGKPESIEPAPRQYNEAALQALDWVIKQFDDAGIRLVVPLFGRYDNFGGMLTYAQWVGRGPDLTAFYTDPAAKALYKDYVWMLLNRTNIYTGRKYKDEPTILAWELADEPNHPDVDRSGNIFHAWATEMAAFVKSIDPNHLLGTGEEGYDTSPAGYSDVASVYNGNFWLLDGNKGMSYTRNTAIPHIDYGTFKFYPELWLMPSKAASGAAWIRDHVRIARAVGKPVVFSEFGDGASARADDPSALDAWLRTLDEEGGGGAQFWQLVSPDWWCDQFCVTHPPVTRISEALRAAATRANSRETPPPLGFTAAATAAPSPATSGQTIGIEASATASGVAGGIVVEIGIWNPAGTRVAERTYSNQSFAADQRRTYSWPWVVPAGLAVGTYRVSVGVFDAAGATTYVWADQAATFAVQAPLTFAVGATSAAPSPLSPGQTLTVASTITASAAASGIVVDLGIWNAAGTRVAQHAVTGQSFAAGGQSRTYTWPWAVPAGLAAGTYEISVGVWDATRQTEYAWDDDAATFAVQAPAPLAFTVGATSASPNPVAPGQTLTAASTITASAAASGIVVDVGVWNAAGTRVVQHVASGQTFAAGQSRGYSWPWTVPAGLPAGTYRVSVGVFSASWTTLYAWVDQAATLTVQAPATLSFSTGPTTASPSPVGRGQSVTVGTAMRASSAASGILVDLEIYDPQGRKVGQQVVSGQSFAAGQTRNYTWTWPVAASQPKGTYTVKIGIFNGSWSTLYLWVNSAGSFQVQ
jgi:mannan endo-1,4-beta-mannosidase